MQATINADERTLYVQLSEQGREHLNQYYRDSRRRFAHEDRPLRDAERHRVWDDDEPTVWWVFSLSELVSIFSGMLSHDFLADTEVELVNPIQ